MTDTTPNTFIAPDHPLVLQIQDTYQRLRQAHASLLAAADRYVAEARQRYEARIETLEANAPNIRRVLAGWDDELWETATPSMEDAVPTAIRVGRLLHKEDPSLNDLPALLPLIGQTHIWIESPYDQVDQGRGLLQNLLLRMILSAPPGSVRLDLTDPIGGGNGLGAILHLPAELRSAKVATRREEIDTLFDTLITHIETVVQTRLLHSYATVGDYNRDQPEIAVPYHLLALPDFPAGITDRAWERLQFIYKNGPRAGVYVLICHDPNREPPRRADPNELWQQSIVLTPQKGWLTWQDATFGEMLALPDDPPPVELVDLWSGALRRVSTQASTHVRFGRVCIPKAQRWQGDAADEFRVPIGVDSSGAVTEFSLGRGNFHALIGGITGYGKSKLLDVLITQLALAYSPDEINFYLMDLKEGVAFQDYIHLPHVRVIALENEREFALNMLRRLQEEIERRSEQFKSTRAGVDNLTDYRRTTHQHMPRLILIMDEFQVLFADEDRIASEAARILEDLARRGRSFGIHLVLSSQSPRGAGLMHDRIFSQVGLRIAFRCDESVSMLVLGEGNTAACELEQPGEAIYNAALGSRSRNVRMRVALLETSERQAFLAEIQHHYRDYRQSPVTFESKTMASLMNNAEWRQTLSAAQPPRRSVKLWLGEPIELKAPTTVELRRERGRNLLIAGSDEAQAYGLLSSAILSLSAQLPPTSLRLIIADFARPETEMEGVMARLFRELPCRPEIVTSRQATTMLPVLVTTMMQRLSREVPADTTICLVIAGLHRWRELRPTDPYKPSEASAQLMPLLEEGPEAGIHTLAWVDSYASFERVLKRGGVNAFDLRVGLRLSESDSTNFLGVPLAGRLAANRALLLDWAESNELEKFKPYPLPDEPTIQAIEGWAKRTPHNVAS